MHANRTTASITHIAPRCGHEIGQDDATIIDMCLPCWRERTRQYAEKMAQLDPAHTRHANCDHAHGYCAA